MPERFNIVDFRENYIYFHQKMDIYVWKSVTQKGKDIFNVIHGFDVNENHVYTTEEYIKIFPQDNFILFKKSALKY